MEKTHKVNNGFSVLLSVYYKEEPQFLNEALNSIWTNQTVKPTQIALVQDGPLTPDLETILVAWKEKLGDVLTLIPLEKNVGLAAALNEGLKYCQHELVARMDTDDVAMPTRFEKQIAFMQQKPEIAASSAQIEEWNTELTQKIDQRNLPTEPEAVARFAKRRSPLSHPVSIFRKSAVLAVGGYPLLRKAQDFALWALLLVNGYKLANLPDILLRMRTGNELLNRRGWSYFKQELQLLKFQKEIGFLSPLDFIINIMLRGALRFPPNFIKKYRLSRSTITIIKKVNKIMSNKTLTLKFLVSGAAGFIGMYTAKRLLEQGHNVIGLDNLNSYYELELKQYRLAQLLPFDNFAFVQIDLADREAMAQLFANEQFDRVIHLAAQAGVRYSIENPFAYVDSNLVGMMTILEGCRHNKVQHLVYASSSSVYGMNDKVPFSEDDQVDNPVSLYAATKKSNELMAHSYSKLYKIPTTGLRFFTVYGPAGRPDMAPWLFTEAIIQGEPIKVFNHGKMMRDFTYIDDIVEGVIRIQNVIPGTEPTASLRPQRGNSVDRHVASAPRDDGKVPYALFNIGNNEPIELERFIKAIETACGREAEKIMLPMQPGDVSRTYADTQRLEDIVGYKPATEIEQGIAKFVDWYKSYRNL